MAPPSFPARAVAALFVERQHLRRPRELTLGAARLERFAADAGGIQLDSINVLDRAHYLTVWSRFGVYDRAALDRLIYRRHALYEYWAHAACLIAAEHLPMWRRAMLDYQVRHTGWRRYLKKNAAVMTAVEEAIRERGPLANADFEHKRRGASKGWWNWKPAMHALHHLWMTGRLLIDSRVHFQKRYDLAERIVPQLASLEVPSAAEFRRWHIRQALHAMGAATDADLRMYLTFPRASVMARRETLAALLASGDVVEVAVDGSPVRWLALAEDLPALATASRRRRIAEGTTLLSPFDSLLWHRERVSRLFGFDYRIEVYTPGPKRTHGYYSLPIYHDGMLIGRLDAKAHPPSGGSKCGASTSSAGSRMAEHPKAPGTTTASRSSPRSREPPRLWLRLRRSPVPIASRSPVSRPPPSRPRSRARCARRRSRPAPPPAPRRWNRCPPATPGARGSTSWGSSRGCGLLCSGSPTPVSSASCAPARPT